MISRSEHLKFIGFTAVAGLMSSGYLAYLILVGSN